MGESESAAQPAERPAERPVTPERPSTSSGWLSWWARTPFTEMQVGWTPASGPTDSKESQSPQPSTSTAQKGPSETNSATAPQNPAPTTWFGLWPANSTSLTGSGQAAPESKSETQPSTEQNRESEDVVMEDAPPEPQQKHQPAPTAGSTWAFWSKDSPKTKGQVVEAESGEIAVIGEGSESHPTPMVEDDVSATPLKASKADSKSKGGKAGNKSTWRKNKRVRPHSMEVDDAASSTGTTTPVSEQDTAPTKPDAAQPASSTPTKPDV